MLSNNTNKQIVKNIIVLVNPCVMSPEKIKQSTQYFPRIPISILAASRLALQEGFKIKIIDLNISDERQYILDNREHILFIGITAMTGYQIRSGLDFAEAVNEISKIIPIVWGGVHVSLLPEQSLQNDLLDIVVIGQGELTLLELAKRLQKNESMHEQKGIGFKENGKIILNSANKFVALEDLPEMPYELVDVDLYMQKQQEVYGCRQFPYVSSMGCPYRCTFCAPSTIAPHWSSLSASRVLNELGKLIKKYSIDEILFYDQEFFINKKRSLEIAESILKRNLNIQWESQIRVNILASMKLNDLLLLKKSGLKQVDMGVESGSSVMLKRINKSITIKQVLKCIKLIKNAGLECCCNFIYGLPKETKKDLYANFRLSARIKESIPEAVLPLFFFEPYPCVPIYNDALEMGAIKQDTLQGWANILNYSYSQISPFTPWLKKKYMDLVFRVIIFYIPLAFPANMNRGTVTFFQNKLENSRLSIFLYLIHKIALWRVKKQFYYFPIEWNIFKLFKNVIRF
ncbi:MAG: radical SAM protein [bacterium]